VKGDILQGGRNTPVVFISQQDTSVREKLGRGREKERNLEVERFSPFRRESTL
jgi:hypothetical protein